MNVMNVEVELQQVRVYEVSVKGVPLGRFVEASSWEGMTRLVHEEDGSILIVNNADRNVYSSIGDPQEKLKAAVVMASMTLLDEMMEA